MASSGNFMTWSSLWSCDSSYPPSPDVFSGGNCRYSSSNSNNGFGATHSFLSGKWYWEVYIVANGNKQLILGLVTPETKNVASQLWNTVGVYGVASGSGVGYKLIENSPGFVEIDGFDDVANGDIIQLAFDRDNYKLWVGRNNTWLESGDPAGDSNPLISGSDFAFQGGAVMPVIGQGSSSTFTMVLNAGQDDTFGGEITAAGNADGNGFGVFKYAPPTGFLAPCSGNLPISDDIDPAQTDTDYPAKNFNTVLFDGNGTTNAVTGLGFQPDLIIGFTRSGAQSKRVVDSTRGGSERLYTDLSDAASTGTATISSFDSDGFTATGGAFNNDSGKTCGAWCWKATGGTTASNGSGSITTTVQANTKAGFSIITYTGNGSNSTIGHGLTKAPELIWVKRRSGSAQNWRVYHASLGATQRLTLNDNRAAETASTFQDTTPSNTVIYIGNDSNINTSGADQLAYAWHGVEGYSKFGSYEGNADNDGPFVYTGFRPRMLWIKEADNADDWVVYDTARDTANTGSSKVTRFESSVVEFDGSTRAIDILSNGFKIRTSNNTINQSSTFVWGCWGDVPFKYNNTF